MVSPPNSGADSWASVPLTRMVNLTVESGSPWLKSVTVVVGGAHSRPGMSTPGSAVSSQLGVGVYVATTWPSTSTWTVTV